LKKTANHKQMKKLSKYFTAILLTFLLLLAGSTLFAQGPGGVPEDPSVGGDNGAVGHPAGGGAPLGTGIIILMSLAAAYGATNILQLLKKKEENLPARDSD
jgi:hypothetical protein